MSYHTGDVTLLLEPKKEAWPVSDSTKDYETCPCPVVFLPHSCEEWIIGGEKEVQLMIHDLLEALRQMGRSPMPNPLTPEQLAEWRMEAEETNPLRFRSTRILSLRVKILLDALEEAEKELKGILPPLD